MFISDFISTNDFIKKSKFIVTDKYCTIKLPSAKNPNRNDILIFNTNIIDILKNYSNHYIIIYHKRYNFKIPNFIDISYSLYDTYYNCVLLTQ